MKSQMYFCFSIFCFIVLFFKTVRAEIPIWQIGQFNDSFNEFDPNKKQLDEYSVSQDWESMLDQNDPAWGEFPAFLYSLGDHENVLKINFDYLHAYSNPTLKIRFTIKIMDPNMQVDINIHHFIDIFKGDIYIDSCPISYEQFNIYNSYDFSLEYIQKGLLEKNSIIIKGRSPYDIRIAFDALYLYIDDMDSDSDGVSDADEGELYKDYNRLVRIPTKVYDPSNKKRISLHIEKLKETTPCFREVGFLDPNTLNLPEWLINSLYLPYECLGFKVEDIGTQDKIMLHINFIDQKSTSLYPYVRFYSYQDSNNWQEMNFELLDGNTAKIPLYDSGEGDFDREKDGIINTIMAISYPRTLDVHVEKRGCFISTVIQGKHHGKDL